MPSINVNSLKLDDCVMVNKGHLTLKERAGKEKVSCLGLGEGLLLFFIFVLVFVLLGVWSKA